MKIIYVIKKNGKIVSWSSKQMCEDEEEIEISEEDFKKLISTINDDEMESVEL
jgi:hypothetical protein